MNSYINNGLIETLIFHNLHFFVVYGILITQKLN